MKGRKRAISAILLAMVITTGTFVPFVQPATAQDESPEPTLDGVDIPDEVTVGESFEVAVDASNEGGRAGAYSTITVSSPDLEQSGDESQVTVTDDADHSYSTVSGPGDEIYDKNGNSMPAEYALAEAGTIEGSYWESGESRSFATEITPEEPGTLTINVRVSLIDDDDNSQKYTAPSSGPEDQQGYTVKQYEVEVKEETEISAEIEDVDPPSGDYTAGEEVTAETTIRNTGNVEHEFYVGYSVRGPDDEWRDNDRSTHESVWIEPGEEETVDVEWEVESDAPSGEYDIWTSVNGGLDGDQLENRLDEKQMMDVFEVVPENSPPTIQIYEPDGGHTVTPGEVVTFELGAEDPDGNLDGIEWYVEGEFTGDTSELQGSSDSATWERTFDSPGTYEVEAVAFDEEGSYSDPVSWTITVEESEEVDAEITDIDVPNGEFTTSEAVESDITIENTGNTAHEFYVGYSVRGPHDEWRDNDRSTHEPVWVEPGQEETVEVVWEVEEDAPTGEYDIWTSVNRGVDGDQLEGRLDNKQLTNVFDIISENSPPTIEADRPERGTNEPLDISVGDTTDFSVTTTDRDGNLETVRWFVDNELRDIVEVDGSRETSTFTTTFRDAGSHSVTAVARDEDDQLSEPVEWSISVEEAEANALIESVDWPRGKYQVGDEVTADVRIQNTGKQEQTFYVGYSVQGRQGDWKDNDESTHTKVTLSSGETQPVEVTWEVTEEASPGSYDTLVAIYADQRDDDLVNRLDETSELEAFSVETARPTVGLDITELPQGEFTPGDTVKTTAEVQNTGNEESTYTVGYRLYGPEGRIMESTTPQEITLQAAERDKITLSRTIPSDAPGGDFDVEVTVTAEDEGEPISVADFSQEEVFTIDTSDIGVGSVKFADETVVAGQTTTGEVSLRNPTDSTQEYQVTAVLVDPNGIEYPTDSNTINSVSIPADTSDSVDFDWRIQDRLPTGAYDMHVKVWPAGEPRSESTRLAKIEREGIIKVATRKEERVSVGAISVNQQTVAPPEDLETTFEVTNTGSETRTFTVTTGLSDSDNIIESERRQVDTITLSPSETKTVSSVFDVDTEAPGGSYDVVVNVFENDTEITERVSEDMFDVFSESYNDVRIGGIYSDPFVSSGDKIETSVLVSLDDVDRSLKVEYTLQDPNGNIITPPNNQRQLSSGQGVLRLDFTHTATQEYQSGAYDIRFSVTTTDDSEMEQIVAQKTDQEALEVSAEDDGSITVIPTTDFSASVDLIRNGEIVSEKYLYNGEELTFDSLPPGQYTVEYQAVKVGGSASVNRTVELAEDESNSIEIKPDSASFSGTVAIDERPLDDATVVVSGRTDTTDEGGVFEFSPQISPGYHTLLVKYDGRTIYRESIQIESGENSQNIEIEYVDPYPNDEFDGEEFLLGAACGQLCTTVGDDEHDNAEYMIGWLVGGFNPVADVRDGLVSAGSGDVVGVGLSVIGLAPYYGDSLSISGRLSRFVDRATPETLYNLREIVRQSSLNGKEKFTNRLYQNSDIRSTLDSKYGVSRSTTKRLGDSRVRKLRAAAGRLGKAGYSDESIGRLIRNHRNKPSKIEELSFSAKYYKDATGSRPKSNSEMLEAVWLNRIRVSESANIARQTAYLGDLSSGNTYVVSGVELAEGGELDTVLFRVGEDGDATVLRAWEAGVGSLDNKPSRQLRTNLANAERGGSSSHDYLDAEAFSRRSMEDKHAGYVGFTDEYDHNLVDEAVPDGGEPVYDKAEYNKMNQDLGIDIQSPVENIGSSKMRVVIERGG